MNPSQISHTELWTAMDRLTTFVANKYELSVSMDGMFADARRDATISIYEIPLTWQCDSLVCSPIAMSYNAVTYSNANTIKTNQIISSFITLVLKQLNTMPADSHTPPVKFSSNYRYPTENWMSLTHNQLIEQLMQAKATLDMEMDKIISNFIELSSEDKQHARDNA